MTIVLGYVALTGCAGRARFLAASAVAVRAASTPQANIDLVAGLGLPSKSETLTQLQRRS